MRYGRETNIDLPLSILNAEEYEKIFTNVDLIRGARTTGQAMSETYKGIFEDNLDVNRNQTLVLITNGAPSPFGQTPCDSLQTYTDNDINVILVAVEQASDELASSNFFKNFC